MSKVKVLWLTESVTRSPIELLWTAKKLKTIRFVRLKDSQQNLPTALHRKQNFIGSLSTYILWELPMTMQEVLIQYGFVECSAMHWWSEIFPQPDALHQKQNFIESLSTCISWEWPMTMQEVLILMKRHSCSAPPLKSPSSYFRWIPSLPPHTRRPETS